jgi:hypothetical protein
MTQIKKFRLMSVLAACSICVAIMFFACNKKTENRLVKAYCIDFNWGEGGAHGFARPGLWAEADPKEHLKWFTSMGCNTILSFAVSCNCYAWYKNGIIPEQPGLKHDFLTEQAIPFAHEPCAGLPENTLN